MLTSISSMIKQLSGLVGTRDLSDWETKFVNDILSQSNDGADTTQLSQPQVEKIDEIWSKHFKDDPTARMHG